MIHDPFGEDVLDFPLHAYIEELKDDIMAFEACGIANPAVVETPASGSAKVWRNEISVFGLSFVFASALRDWHLVLSNFKTYTAGWFRYYLVF